MDVHNHFCVLAFIFRMFDRHKNNNIPTGHKNTRIHEDTIILYLDEFLTEDGATISGLLLTYGLATRHACYAPATRPLRARYSPSIYMCGSPKTRRYLLNKSSNTIIWRLNIRQVNKDLYVEVESPRQVVNESMRKCVEVCRPQYEKKPA